MSRLPLALAVIVLAGLPACSAGDSEDTEGAQQAADDLAAALTKGEYGDLEDVVAGMGGLPAKVAAGDVNIDLVYVATRNRVVFGAADLEALRRALAS